MSSNQLSPEEMMAAMVNQNVAPQMEMPTMVNPGMVNPAMVQNATPQMEMPTMVNPGVAQVNNPQMEMPTMVDPSNTQINLVDPVAIQNNSTVVMETQQPTIVQQTERIAAIEAGNNAEAATTLNLQNGLDLDNVMTPEEQVRLNNQEVVAKPITINGLESIGSCRTSSWSALITILDFIAKELSNNDIIVIENGLIDTHRKGNFIHCDMRNILGNISLNLTSPDTSVKSLKLIKGGELIQIFKESATNSYVFCNIFDGKIGTRVKTSYAADSVAELSKAPLLPSPVFKKEIPNQEREVIKTIIAGRSLAGSEEPFRFGFSKVDNSLVSIGVGKNFTHFFKDSSIEIDEYRVFNPFPVPNMESCIIEFFKCQDGSTWIRTISNISVSSVICTEKIELIDGSIEDFDFS